MRDFIFSFIFDFLPNFLTPPACQGMHHAAAVSTCDPTQMGAVVVAGVLRLRVGPDE